MSAITVVGNVVPAGATGTLPNLPAAPAETTSQPAPTSATAARPADVVSLSSPATTATVQTSPPLRAMDQTQVDDALSWVSGANGFAFIYAHWDYAHVAAQYGKAIADRDEAGLKAAAADSASFALSNASAIGIPVKDSVSPDAVKNGAAPGTITVGAFSFTSGGSTYAITPSANGTLVGTKDGQAWQTWQLIDPDLPGNLAGVASGHTDAATTLQTLIEANKQKLPQVAASSGPVNILT